MAALPQIEILLPVYNELDSLQPLVAEIDQVTSKLRAKAQFHFLFVDDGSTDGSSHVLRKLADNRDDTRVVRLSKNFGHANALAAGIAHFQSDALIVMDADLQDSPNAITGLLEAWLNGANTVVVERGDRTERAKWLFKAFHFLFRRFGEKVPDIAFGTHCLIDHSVVARLKELPERSRYLPGLVAFSSGRIASIKLDRGARQHGESRVGTWGLFRLAVTALLSFSSLPIHLVSLFGLLASLSAAAAGVVIVGIRLLTDFAIPGWASMMTAIAFASGIQLFCLGLMGEYVARIYEEVKRRPLYWVDTIHGIGPSAVQNGRFTARQPASTALTSMASEPT
jgi:polyisoprenyl-phosphate glycosyltransferase